MGLKHLWEQYLNHLKKVYCVYVGSAKVNSIANLSSHSITNRAFQINNAWISSNPLSISSLLIHALFKPTTSSHYFYFFSLFSFSRGCVWILGQKEGNTIKFWTDIGMLQNMRKNKLIYWGTTLLYTFAHKCRIKPKGRKMCITDYNCSSMFGCHVTQQSDN